MGEDCFTAGEDAVFSIPPHTPHSLVGTDCCIITIQFEQTFFERTLPSPKHPDFICNSAVYGDSEAFHQMRRLIARLIKNNAEQQLGYELRNWSIIYEIMDVMYQEFRVDESEAKNQRAHRYSARMEQISRILNEQYQENMTLAALASQVHLSVPYLSKFFEKQFGLSFLSYLTRIRLNHAVELLLHTDATIEAVSADSRLSQQPCFCTGIQEGIRCASQHLPPPASPTASEKDCLAPAGTARLYGGTEKVFARFPGAVPAPGDFQPRHYPHGRQSGETPPQMEDHAGTDKRPRGSAFRCATDAPAHPEGRGLHLCQIQRHSLG